MTTNPYESPEHKAGLPQPPSDRWGSALRIVALLGLLGLLLLCVTPRRFFSGGARESARRAACNNNLRNIALALQQYESVYRCLPPAYTVDASGKPLHSWRTLILPFLDQQHLYKKIDLSKPWDDPANQEAFNTLPRLYECPSSTADPFMTTYLAIVAPGGCFQSGESTPFAAIKDRRDRTLLVIEVSEKHAVHWMSPHDATEEMILHREADEEFSHPNGSQAAFVDGHIEHLTKSIRAAALRAMISIDGNDDNLAIVH